jgi:hypothetical protein
MLSHNCNCNQQHMQLHAQDCMPAGEALCSGDARDSAGELLQADRSGEHPAWGVPSPPQLDDSFGELRPGSAASGDTCWYDDVELPMLERLPV